MRPSHFKHYSYALCVCVYACAISSLAFIDFPIGHGPTHASEVPRDLIAFRLRSGS